MPDSGELDFFLDLRSFGRRGPGHRDRLTPAQIALIARTVRRVPEVMVKISGGATSAKGAVAHLKYIDRHGRLQIETDEGSQLKGKGSERSLADDWQLELDALEAVGPHGAVPGRRPTKVTQNIVLSMPAGTPPNGLLAAARDFAREEFALKHRYAMVLHTDQAHPHVHLVVRTLDEDGKRLRIRRETLRQWRASFAHHLRAHGIEANATPRAVRGQSKTRKRDGIYRAMRRGASTHMYWRVHEITRDLPHGWTEVDSARETLRSTRDQVVRGWLSICEALRQGGNDALASELRNYVASFSPPRREQDIWRERPTAMAIRSREGRPRE